MPYDPTRHHRRSIRLKGYDYSGQGPYFVTVCAQGRRCLFGSVANGRMEPNARGQMVAEAWLALSERFAGIEFDAWVVMPNHFHGILALLGGQEAEGGRAKPTLGQIVGAFKSITTGEYIRGVRR